MDTTPRTTQTRPAAPRASRLPRALAFGLLTGAGSLIPLDRTPVALRRALIAGTGLAAGVAAPIALRRVGRAAREEALRSAPAPTLLEPTSTEPRATPAVRAASALAVGTGAAAAAAGGAWFAFAADRACLNGLRRLGAKRPRAWFGAVGLVLGTALEYVDTEREDDTSQD